MLIHYWFVFKQKDLDQIFCMKAKRDCCIITADGCLTSATGKCYQKVSKTGFQS